MDVTFAYDDPGTSNHTKAMCRLGGKPCISHNPNTNLVVEQALKTAAELAEVKYQSSPSGKLEENDAKGIQEAACGVAMAAIGIPNRNMHSAAEVCSMADNEAAAQLLAAFVIAITPDTDFRPSRSVAVLRTAE